MRLIALFVLLLVCWKETNAQSQTRAQSVKFTGRDVTIMEPELDADGLFPKGPASVCLEAPPQRQCYTAPRDFGRPPTVEVVHLDKDAPALFFSAASGGVSGWMVYLALLRPGQGKDLENLTAGTYSPEDAHILDSEKQEILARLRSVKAEMERENKAR